MAPLRKGDLIEIEGEWIRVLDGRAKIEISVPGEVHIDRSGRSIAKEADKRKDTSSITK